MLKILGKKFREFFKGKVDEASIEQLEQLFYEADLGVETSHELTEIVRKLYQKQGTEEILNEIKKKLVQDLAFTQTSTPTGHPHVILIVGVNGNGKTTTLAKLAHYYQSQGKKTLIAAADTFRAAAIDQLEKWAHKIGCDIVKGKPGSDPAAVTFDAISAAKVRGTDVVLIDTAGRLHTKTDLMKELEKITRVSSKALPGAPHEILLVLDATVGQNAVEQALVFHKFAPLSGLILTKIDGTAKGGSAIALQKKLRLPIKYLGTGEKIENLQPFDARAFVDRLFEP